VKKCCVYKVAHLDLMMRMFGCPNKYVPSKEKLDKKSPVGGQRKVSSSEAKEKSPVGEQKRSQKLVSKRKTSSI
jgi:hypothetical protein